MGEAFAVGDVKPYCEDTRTESGAMSNPGSLPLLPPMHAAQSPLNLSGSHSGAAPHPLQSPLHQSQNPAFSEPCGHALDAPSLMHQANGVVHQGSFSSRHQLCSMAQVRPPRNAAQSQWRASPNHWKAIGARGYASHENWGPPGVSDACVALASLRLSANPFLLYYALDSD